MAAIDPVGAILFTRCSGKVIDASCSACLSKEYINEKDYGLTVELSKITFVLCTFHEGVLLEKLLTNYLKRKRRDSKVGFLGPIWRGEITSAN